CDYSAGKWVRDPREGYDENCPFLDPGFRCRRNGRSDDGYRKWRWQPHGCDLPRQYIVFARRFDAEEFLRRGSNRVVVFAGDSIGRNQWESLICMAAEGVADKKSIQEENGNPITKHKGFLSVKFRHHNLTIQYYRVPYLVAVDRPPPGSPAKVRGAIRVDKLHWFSKKWAGADAIVFAAGHWWNPDKTIKSGHYFQEGDKVNMTMEATEGFRRSVKTLQHWIYDTVDMDKTILLFRGYSPTHYSREGEWDGGGHCDRFTEPEMDMKSNFRVPMNNNNRIVAEAVEEMRRKKMAKRVEFLNVTLLTEWRKDGHPSRHREAGVRADAPQDCSHWCLPGVPDTWNQIMYAQMLR
ncbi:hypothetical protein M569_09098, partial [Genlisea aurea]